LGYAAIRVHGRTVEQKYAGRSRRPFLKDVKEAFPDWFVWGSGDVFEPDDVVDMLTETGVDGVWIARGAIGNPWIFRDAEMLLKPRRHGGTEARSGSESDTYDAPPPPTIWEQRHALLEHFEEAVTIHGEALAGRRMRKMGIKYARFHPEAGAVKARFVQVRSMDTWRAVIDDFYAVDGPGVRPPRDVVDEVNATSGCGVADA
jgi:tRNA-dihydrouridine synthase